MAGEAANWWTQSAEKWAGLFSPAVKSVLKQVHPNLGISDDSVVHMDKRMYNLLAHICANNTDGVPTTIEECEVAVRAFFPEGSNELANWAVSEAEDAVQAYITGKKKKCRYQHRISCGKST